MSTDCFFKIILPNLSEVDANFFCFVKKVAKHFYDTRDFYIFILHEQNSRAKLLMETIPFLIFTG